MNLLASAIPGMRAIRAPLVAGYAWLVVAWLYFDPDPDFRKAEGVLGQFVDLARTVGPVGTAVGVSVAAYLLGSFSMGLAPGLSKIARRVWYIGHLWHLLTQAQRKRKAWWRFDSGAADAPSERQSRAAARPRSDDWPSPTRRALGDLLILVQPVAFSKPRLERQEGKALEEAMKSVQEYFTEGRGGRDLGSELAFVEDHAQLLLSRAVPDRYPHMAEVQKNLMQVWPGLESREFAAMLSAIRDLRSEMKQELKLPATILVGDQPELYAEADRLRAEAEFRTAIVPPLIALIWLLATETTAWCWVLVIVPYLLLAQASGFARTSEFLIDEALARDKAPSPALEKFRRRVSETLAGHQASLKLPKAQTVLEEHKRALLRRRQRPE